jgi:type VI secretion system secreted protein Hcp
VNNEFKDVKPKNHLHSILPVAVVAIATSLPADSFGQTFVLKLGDIQGESDLKGFNNQIDIVSWSWGVQNNTDPGNPHGAQATIPQFSSVQFTKSTDNASPKIFEAMAKREIFPEATLTALVLRDPISGHDKTLEVTLTNLAINSMSVGTVEDGGIVDLFSLAPAKVQMQFYVQDPSSGSVIKSDCFGWDVVKNEEVKC